MAFFKLANGEELYYEDTGSGEKALVMMHGWTSSHETFAKPIELLRSQARCIAYDHRGCLEGLDVPLAYFFANPGSLFSPELAGWYEANAPCAFKAVRFENASHLLVDEQPDKFAAEVSALL